MVGSVVEVLKQPCVFTCSLGWELWRVTGPILESTLVALVKPPISLVCSSSSSTKVLSEVC